jgi:CRISPR system Cascade subunit CasA
MCFYRIDGEGIHLMKLSREKSFWRDVHTILEKKTDTKNVRPECIKLAAYTKEEGILTEDKIFILHIAGISASKAKVFLWRHERMPLPVIVIVNQNLHERLNTSTTEAEILAIKAKDRIEKILRMYLSPDQNKSIDKKQLEKLVEAFDPRPVFWSRLEKHFYEFLENLPGDWDLKKNEWKADDKQEATKKWRKRILQEAHDALKESALSLGTTSRALRAVARTRLYFIVEDLKPLKKKEVNNTKKSGQKGGMEN